MGAWGVPWNTLRPVRIAAGRTYGASSVLSGKTRGPCEVLAEGVRVFSSGVRPISGRMTDQLMRTSGYETRPSLCVCPSGNPNSNPIQIRTQSTSFAKTTCIASTMSLELRTLETHQRMTEYDIPRRVLRQLFPYLFYGPFELLVYLHGQGLFVDLDREGFGGFGGFEAEFLR